MPAQISTSLKDWSTTAGSNQPGGSANVGPDLDDNLRAMQVPVRNLMTRDTIASAATCDIGTKEAHQLTITGTTGITSLGTSLGSAGYGIRKKLTFAGILTLTNSASLACITSANITTAAGDACEVEYSASGWTMLWYARKTGAPVAVQSFALSDLGNATAAKTLANGTFKQTWGWSGMGASDIGLVLEGLSAGNNGKVLQIKSNNAASGNVATLLEVLGWTSSPLLSITPNSFVVNCQANPGVGNGADSSIKAASANSGGSNNGGTLTLSGGDGGLSGGGTGGNVTLQPGTGATKGAAKMVDAAGGSIATVQVDSVAVTLSGTSKAVLDTKHLFVDNTNGSPTITAGGGTGATISGSDVLFEVTFGTGSPTSVTVTFANAWASAPQVLVSGTQSGQVLHYSAATNTVQILSSAAFNSGTKVSVLCIGKQ